jgi:hypothetical protein
MHWSDAQPLILPADPEASHQLPVPKRAATKKSKVADKPLPIRRNGLRVDIPRPGEPLPETKAAKEAKPKTERTKRACDPRFVAAARELRDRWMEQVNSEGLRATGHAKYDVSRQLEGAATITIETPLLAA